MTAASPQTAAALVEPAPAKINLYLHVLGRRPDGFHDLDSLAVFTDIGDVLTVTPADRLDFALEGPFASVLAAEPVDGNLVWRAAARLAARFDRVPAVRLVLDKRLPVASGIGGGSADAAACLRALCRLWGIAPDHPEVVAVAAELGSDVPVCLVGQTRYFAGRGERLDPGPLLPPVSLVLANPGIPLATPAVFRARSGPFSGPGRFEATPVNAADLAAQLRQRGNDLAAAAVSLVPEIGAVLEALAATPGCLLARLSGSGPTCFGLYADPGEAAVAAERLIADHPAWWVRAGRLL